MPPAITVAGLGKSYTLRHNAPARNDSLREAVTGTFSALPRRLAGMLGRKGSPTREEFWALRNVDLTVAEGERIGIIGRNGAGKSTLLKVLSRITEPTEGTVRVRGRVASMLEVGTGFHPELTGRENIFLNGSILGMKRAEIVRKFDEIVAFAEIERFLDTPTKRYSSGMYLRLAFAVAAHLEPDILVVDEVLAVGDVQFQKKCLGKMQEIGKEGRTVLFVSHNMAAIEGLCTRAIVLDGGGIVREGGVDEQIAYYLQSGHGTRGSLAAAVAVGHVRVDVLEFTPNPVGCCARADFRIELGASEGRRLTSLALVLETALGVRAGIIDLRGPAPYVLTPDQPLRIQGSVAPLPLVEGEYGVGVFVGEGGDDAWVRDLITLRVAPLPARGEVIPYSPTVRGIAHLQTTFRVSTAP